LLAVFLLACGGSDGPKIGNGNGTGVGVGAGGDDTGGDEDAGNPTMRPDASTKPTTALDFTPGTVLVQVANKDGTCSLRVVAQSIATSTPHFPCTNQHHVFRRSDHAWFFSDHGKIYQRKESGDEELATKCAISGRFDFDKQNHVYYRCAGGDTGKLYKDDALVIDNAVAEMEGTFDDGRVIYHRKEDFHVIKGATEESTYHVPFQKTALEDATTVSFNQAFVIYVDHAPQDGQYYDVISYSTAGWKEQSSTRAEEPPPANFGSNLRVTPRGNLFVALDGKVRRYDAVGGKSRIVLMLEGVTASSELVYYP
jgi:hypothetical protein